MYSVKVNPADLFQSLGEPTRLRIIRLAVSLPKEEFCLCDLKDALQDLESNISRHLKVLRQCGLLTAEKEGRWVYHRLVPSKAIEPFYTLVKTLSDQDGVYAEDLLRMKSELKKRNSDRCRKSISEQSEQRIERKRR
ncbi:transcriptional regulator, ArsR family protein [Bdellovibrio bacteriovorus W]|nr:transcriptional regulator, ArsR family protein [Bdellovibrio bacteriovorus W]